MEYLNHSLSYSNLLQVYDSCGNFVCIIGRQGIASVLLGNKGSNQGVFDTPSGVALSPGKDVYIIVCLLHKAEKHSM